MSEKPEPPIHWQNLFIVGQLQYQFLAVFFPQFLLVFISYSVVAVGWSYCSNADFTPLVRAGTVIQGITFFYVFLSHWVDITEEMAKEIEGSFAYIDVDANPETQIPLEKFRRFAKATIAWRRRLIIFLECSLVILGTALSGFGDLIGQWLVRS